MNQFELGPNPRVPTPYILQYYLEEGADGFLSISHENIQGLIYWWLDILREQTPDYRIVLDHKEVDSALIALASDQREYRTQTIQHAWAALTAASQMGQQVIPASVRLEHVRPYRTVLLAKTENSQAVVLRAATSQDAVRGYGIGPDALNKITGYEPKIRERGVVLPIHRNQSVRLFDATSGQTITMGVQLQPLVYDGTNSQTYIESFEDPEQQRQARAEVNRALAKVIALLRTHPEEPPSQGHIYGQYAYADGTPVTWRNFEEYFDAVLEWQRVVVYAQQRNLPGIGLDPYEFGLIRHTLAERLNYRNLDDSIVHGDLEPKNLLADAKTVIDWDGVQEGPLWTELAKMLKPVLGDPMTVEYLMASLCTELSLNPVQRGTLFMDALHGIIFDELDRYIHTALSFSEEDCWTVNQSGNILHSLIKEETALREYIILMHEKEKFYGSLPETNRDREYVLDAFMEGQIAKQRLEDVIASQESLRRTFSPHPDALSKKIQQITGIVDTIHEVMQLIQNPDLIRKKYNVDVM